MRKESDLRRLKLNLLLKELDMIELSEKYSQEFNDYYRPLFMTEAAKHSPETSSNTKQSQGTKSSLKSFDVTDEEAQKIKEIFRSIAKQCHPDKTQDCYLNELYKQSHAAYESNDLLTLYKITQLLNIEIEIDEQNIFLLQRIVNERKERVSSLESSFLWLWVHSKSEEKKEEIIKKYISALSAS
jgi:hypothetical protein